MTPKRWPILDLDKDASEQDIRRAYAQRLRELPGMRRWYADALRESWRDRTHEDEAKQVGTLLEDLRAPVD